MRNSNVCITCLQWSTFVEFPASGHSRSNILLGTCCTAIQCHKGPTPYTNHILGIRGNIMKIRARDQIRAQTGASSSSEIPRAPPDDHNVQNAPDNQHQKRANEKLQLLLLLLHACISICTLRTLSENTCIAPHACLSLCTLRTLSNNTCTAPHALSTLSSSTYFAPQRLSVHCNQYSSHVLSKSIFDQPSVKLRHEVKGWLKTANRI